MSGAVLLSAGAEQDLASIYDFIADSKGERAAERVLDRLLRVVQRLRDFPEQGSHPPELSALGIRDFRQVMLKPYRIFYRAMDERVIILLIADSRRDMQTLLAQRLLRS